MAADTTWHAFGVHEPENRPNERLAIALDMAREQGLATDRVIVGEATAAETKPPAGVTLVGSEIVRWYEYRFKVKSR